MDVTKEINAVYYAMRLINHRADLSLLTSRSAIDNTAQEFTVEEEQAALRIVKDGELTEGVSVSNFTDLQVQKHLRLLSSNVDGLIEKELLNNGIGVEEGRDLIELLRSEVPAGLDQMSADRQARQGQEQDSAHLGSSLIPGFIYSSPAMTRLVEEVHKIRSSDVNVLISGESGTGKELLARAIHDLSPRARKPFVSVNCGAFTETLLEAELFGYTKGSFTGATANRKGLFEAAEQGTLLLDEIGHMSPAMQVKLLRVLHERKVRAVGAHEESEVNARVIATTNRDLGAMVKEGTFRQDLYYRLNVIRLRVPPLRERKSEIPTIVNYYLNQYSAELGRDIQITPEAVDLLMAAEWPGNVRQLSNEVQRLIARAKDGTFITPELLSPELLRVNAPLSTLVRSIGPDPSSPSSKVRLENLTLAEAVAEVERRMINEALRKHNGNVSRAARELGLTRRGLYLKLDRDKDAGAVA